MHPNPGTILPPILRPGLLLNLPSPRKRFLQTLPLILHIIQQLRQLMSPRSNRPYRRNLFCQRPTSFIRCVLRILFSRVKFHDLNGAVLSVPAFEDVSSSRRLSGHELAAWGIR